MPFGGSAKVCAVIIPQCVSCSACTRSLALASGICCRQVYSKLKLTLRLLLRRSKLEGGLVLTSWCPNSIVSFSTEFSTSDFHVHAFSFGSRNSSPRVQYTPHQWSHHQNSPSTNFARFVSQTLCDRQRPTTHVHACKQ